MRKAILLPCLAALMILTWLACSKKETDGGDPSTPGTGEVTTPTVVADSIGSITISSATFFGNITSNGGATVTDRGIYWGKTANPSENKTPASSYLTTGKFSTQLSGLDPNTTYYVRGYATNSEGTVFTSDVQFVTEATPAVEMYTDTMFASGATTLFAAGKVLDDKGLRLTETGICLSTAPDPDVEDTKVTGTADDRSLFLRFNNLEPLTDYYIRAYSIDQYGTVAYGETVKVSTIQKGNVTYTLAENTNPTDEEAAAYARIKAAFDKAVAYYNEFSGVTKTEYVTYNTGVATADATFAGNIRMGPVASYQQTGTALHEMAHTVGVGTHWYWTSNLIQGGVYQGVYANKMLQFMSRSSTAFIQGDTQHFWPDGINGASEDTGDEMLYITNVMIIQGMKKDGLPSN